MPYSLPLVNNKIILILLIIYIPPIIIITVTIFTSFVAALSLLGHMNSVGGIH